MLALPAAIRLPNIKEPSLNAQVTFTRRAVISRVATKNQATAKATKLPLEAEGVTPEYAMKLYKYDYDPISHQRVPLVALTHP